MSVRRAQDERIEGTPDGLNAITEISDVPDTPTVGSPSDVGTSRPYNNASATIAVTANATGGTPTSYTVTSSPGGLTGTGTSPVTVTGLNSQTSYTFTATATNTTGTSPASTASGSVIVTSVPATPSAPTATDQGTSRPYNNGQASVSFSAPASGGKTISSYTVTSSPGSLTGTGSTSPITVTGLSSATAYTYTVTATNANGTSSASSASGSVTATTVPQAPTIGTVTATNSTTVSIPFTGATGGSALTSVAITSSPSISLSYSGTTSPITVTGSFALNQAYTFTMTATNANGASSSSSASNSVTPFALTYGAFQFHGADATNFSNGAWNGLGARKFTFSGETFAAITSAPTYKVRTGGYSNTSVAGYAAGGSGRTSAMIPSGVSPYASFQVIGTPPTTDMRNINTAEKLTYSSESWSTLSSTITLSSTTGQTIDTTGMSNSGTAGYAFNSTTSSYSSGNFVSANTAVSKMPYSNDTFSSLGTIAATSNAPFQSIYSSGQSQLTATNYRTAISNSGTAGYLFNGTSGGGGSVNQFYKWAYSTDTYSATAQAFSTYLAMAWTSGFSNGSTAGYFFDTSTSYNNPVFKYTFSNDTLSSVSTLSTNRGRGTSTSNGTTAGYIFGGNLPPVTSTDKLTFSTDTRSTIAATITAWDASTTISSNSA